MNRSELHQLLVTDLGLVPQPALPTGACTYFLREVQWHPARSTRTVRVLYGPDGAPTRLQLCASSDNNNTVLLQLPRERQQLVSAVLQEIQLVEQRLRARRVARADRAVGSPQRGVGRGGRWVAGAGYGDAPRRLKAPAAADMNIKG